MKQSSEQQKDGKYLELDLEVEIEESKIIVAKLLFSFI